MIKEIRIIKTGGLWGLEIEYDQGRFSWGTGTKDIYKVFKEIAFHLEGEQK